MNGRSDALSHQVVSAEFFPPLLLEMPDPPARLFIAGKPLEPAPSVAIVGTRKPTPYGVQVAQLIAQELASSGVTIVSGLARGIDAAAHKGALDVGGTTIAVLGCGVDVRYPQTNGQLYDRIAVTGSLVSEYALGTPPLPHHFPVRNRIIAGLSHAVVVIEGMANGGAMITARLAGEMGREVFAVPGPVHSAASRGPHDLIRDGARLVTSATQLLSDLGWSGSDNGDVGQPMLLNADQSRVLEALTATPALPELVAVRAGMPVSTVICVLGGLEVLGAVLRLPGGRFATSPAFRAVR